MRQEDSQKLFQKQQQSNMSNPYQRYNKNNYITEFIILGLALLLWAIVTKIMIFQQIKQILPQNAQYKQQQKYQSQNKQINRQLNVQSNSLIILQPQIYDNQQILQYQDYYPYILSHLVSITLSFSENTQVCRMHYLMNTNISKVQQIKVEILAHINSNQKQNMVFLLPSNNQSIINQENIRQQLNQTDEYQIAIQINQIRADYHFFSKSFESAQCGWIILGHGHLSQKQVVNTSILLYYSKNNEFNLSQANMYDTSISKLQQFSYAFRIQLFNHITPLNFAYNIHYTFQQLFLYPMLSLLQGSSFISQTNNLIVQKTQKFSNPKQYQLSNLPEQNYHTCFMAIPTNLSSNNNDQILQYLKQIQQQNDKKMSIIFSIVYFPQNKITSFENIIQKTISLYNQLGIRIRFRIRYQNIQTSLQLYDSAYSYCPYKSIIFFSRTNIIPKFSLICQQIQKQQLCHKNKNDEYNFMMIPNYYNQNSQQTNLQMPENITRTPQNHIYHKYLKHAQIFCSMIVRTTGIQDYKWQQTQFYQTQLSYAMYYLQSSQNKFVISKNPLFTLKYIYQQTQKQLLQIDGLVFRNFGKSFSVDKPQVQYSGLHNKGLKRYAPDIIPKILHQIWLIDDPNAELSQVRKQLIKTLKQTNPDFQYRLWKKADITRQNFPITYETLIKLISQNEKASNNFYAVISDIMRIQILYHHGGIYTDLKTQGRKSLKPFLKYTQFWFDVGIKVKKNQGGRLVNGIIGSIPYHNKFKVILTDFFSPNNVTLPISRHIYEETGSPRLPKAYNPKQLMVDILNFGPFLAGNTLRICLNENLSQKFTKYQKVFKGKNQKNQQYQIGIPCLINTEKYLEMYRCLGRSYFNKKQYKI